MKGKSRWVGLLAALVLVGNFYVLMRYGYALRSTNLFIARSLVFYPLAWLNLIVGIVLLVIAVAGFVRRE